MQFACRRVAGVLHADMVRQEIYGYLLAHHALSALICQAATEADIDPDRVKFTRTVRIVRRAIGPADFPLTSTSTSWLPSGPTSPAAAVAAATSTPNAATGPTRASSNEPATTPTASKDPATRAPATASHPPSNSSALLPRLDQLTVSGIASRRRRSFSYGATLPPGRPMFAPKASPSPLSIERTPVRRISRNEQMGYAMNKSHEHMLGNIRSDYVSQDQREDSACK